LIQDVKLVPQVSSPIAVQLDDAGIADFFDEQVARGLQPARFSRLWIHTHPANCALPSAVDEATFARVFGKADWRVMCILARGGQFYARLESKFGRRNSVRLGVEIGKLPRTLVLNYRAWKTEFQRKVRIAPGLDPEGSLTKGPLIDP
jgi:hypothetical protein